LAAALWDLEESSLCARVRPKKAISQAVLQCSLPGTAVVGGGLSYTLVTVLVELVALSRFWQAHQLQVAVGIYGS